MLSRIGLILCFLFGTVNLSANSASPFREYATLNAGQTTPDGKLTLVVETPSLGHHVVLLKNIYFRPMAIDFYRVSPGGCTGQNLHIRSAQSIFLCFVTDPANLTARVTPEASTPTPRPNATRTPATTPTVSNTPEPFGPHASVQVYLSWHEIPRPPKPSPSPFVVPTAT
jgi:hypothetical protein